MKFSSIKYELSDLIQILKNNTADLCDLKPNQVFVNFWVQNGKLKSAEVKRIDGKVLEIQNS